MKDYFIVNRTEIQFKSWLICDIEIMPTMNVNITESVERHRQSEMNEMGEMLCEPRNRWSGSCGDTFVLIYHKILIEN